MADVGELFVRIRPAAGTQAALTAEAEGPVAAAGRDLSKVFLAAFAIGGIAKTIESVVHAATEHQSAFAVLEQTTLNAGASTEIFGQSIESLLEKEARLKGFTDEDLASSFVRLVSATRNSEEAFKDLGLAEDVARARHIDLANAALAISKAEQGSATALQRLGIVVHPVTAAVDGLKKAHEDAIIAGAKFTDQQKQIYAQALLNAAAQDKEATRLSVLATLQQRFGGDAATFANTASGQFQRLQADFHQFEVSVGTVLLRDLASASEAVGSFFTRATQNESLKSGIIDTLEEIKSVAQTVGPPLIEVAKAAGEVAGSLGGPAIITAVAAWEGFRLVQSRVAAAQSLYARVVAAGRDGVIAETTAEQAHSSAIAANTDALAAQASVATETQASFSAALAKNTESIVAQTAATERLAQVTGEADLAATTQAAIGPTEALAAASEATAASVTALEASLTAATTREDEFVLSSSTATAALGLQAAAAERLSLATAGLESAGFAPTAQAAPEVTATIATAGEGQAVAGLDAFSAASTSAGLATRALTDALVAEAASFDVLTVAATEARIAVAAVPQSRIAQGVAAEVAPTIAASPAALEQGIVVDSTVVPALEAQAAAVARLTSLIEQVSVVERTFTSATLASRDALLAANVAVDQRAASFSALAVQENLAAEAAARTALTPAGRAAPAAVAAATVAPVVETRSVDALVVSEGRAAAGMRDLTAATEAQNVAAERAVTILGPLGQELAVITIQAEGAVAAQEALGGSLSTLQTSLAGVTTETTALGAAEEGVGVAAATAAPQIATLGAAFAGATVEQIAYNEALLAGAPAAATIVAGDTALAAALAKVDAARVASIAALGRETVGAEADAAATLRLAEADNIAAAAAIQLGLATQATAAYFTEAGAAATVAAAETTAASGGLLAGAGRLGLAAIGGPAGAAAIAVGGLAFGLYKLFSAEGAVTAATHGLKNAVDDLATALHTDKVDALTLAQAKLTLRQDEAALSASSAARGSVEYQQLLLNVANDSLRVSDAQQALQSSLEETTADFEKQRQKVIELSAASIEQAQISDPSRHLHTETPPSGQDLANEQRRAATSFAEGITSTIDAQKNLTPLQEHNLGLLKQFAEVFGRVPTHKQIEIILKNTNVDVGLDAIRRKAEGLPALVGPAAAAAATALTNQFNTALVQGASKFGLGGAVKQMLSLLPGETGAAAVAAGFDVWSQTQQGIIAAAESVSPTFADIVRAQLAAINGDDAEAAGEKLGANLLQGFAAQVFPGFNAIIEQVNAEIAAGKKAAAEKALNIQIDPLKQSIADDQARLGALQQQATDTAVQGAQALSDAINQAKQNLNSIGQQIANTLFQFIDQPLQKAAQRISDAQAKLTQLGDEHSLKLLSQEVILPGSKHLSSDPAEAIKQLEALRKTRDSPALDAYILQFRSLALQVQGDKNTVQTNAAALVKTAAESRLANLTELFNEGRISQKTLEADVTALLEKNGLTAKTAKTRGASFAATLAGELAGLQEQAGAISSVGGQGGSGLIPSITRPIDTLNATQKSLAANAQEQRKVQIEEAKTHTKILTKIHASQTAQKFTSSLDHNPGAGAHRTNALVGTGG